MNDSKNYIVAIRKNSTGEIRLRKVDQQWVDGHEWWWTEGNMGCDCNRYLEFERAGGNMDCWDEPEGQETPCGDVLYSVLYAELPSGERIVIDKNAGSIIKQVN